MRQEIIVQSLVRRAGQPANLLVMGLVGGMFCLFQVTARFPQTRLADLLLPFILLFGHLVLAPVPWQWTGTDADRAGLGRGFAQALCFDALWIALVLASLHLLGGPAPPPHPPEPFPFHAPPPPRGQPFGPGLGLGLVNLAFGMVYGWVCAAKEGTEASERRIALLLRQSRARALQSQLEPHVLFNALNGIAELVHEDPLAAEESIARLADLYRMLTVHGEAALVRLEQERGLVEAYLAMEQMRLGERLQVVWQWPDWADPLVLPPLFLLPMVENAIKHGIAPAAEGGQVVVCCERLQDRVRLVVENTGQALRQDGHRGVGLCNLEARLDLWTEYAGSFMLSARGPWTVATVQWRPEA